MAMLVEYPTEERIREVCEEIRRGWTPSQEISRRVSKSVPYTIPTITRQSFDCRSRLWEEIGSEEESDIR